MSRQPPKETPYIDVAGLVIDGFEGCSDDDLREMARSGFIYTPYSPLQVSVLQLDKDPGKKPRRRRQTR